MSIIYPVTERVDKDGSRLVLDHDVSPSRPPLRQDHRFHDDRPQVVGHGHHGRRRKWQVVVIVVVEDFGRDTGILK